MTKLSFLVTTVFLLLAAAMWYLASASFKEHIHNKIKILGQESTNLTVQVNDLQQLSNGVSISEISFHHSHNDESPAVIVISGIYALIEQEPTTQENKSKKNIIEFKTLSIAQVKENFSSPLEKEKLINTIKQSITAANNTEVHKKAPVLIMKQLSVNETNVLSRETETLLNVEKTEQQIFNELLLRILTIKEP